MFVKKLPGSLRRALQETPVPWGPLGYVVYRRTYSRRREDLGRTEEWGDTVERCLQGLLDYGMAVTEDELVRMGEHFHQLRIMPAGRGLWQLGTETVARLGGASVQNCLAGETKVLTRYGWKQIKDLAGTSTEVVTRGGKWVTAPFHCYGKQKLIKIVCSEHKDSEVVFHATPDHRWFLHRKKGNEIELTTKELKVGDRLTVLRPRNSVEFPSPQGIAHGITFGDGCRTKFDCVVDLCGVKKELAHYFSENRSSVSGEDHIQFGGLPWHYKEMPDLFENKSYLMGWLVGWLATDGSVNVSTGQISASNSSREVLEKVKDIASILGFRTGKISLISDTNPFNSEPRQLWQICFIRADNPERLLLRSDHVAKSFKGEAKSRDGLVIKSIEETDRFEDVYCANVDVEGAFVIEGNVLTGNCWFTPINSLDSFVFMFDQLMLGGGVGFSVLASDVYKLPGVRTGVRVERRDANDADFIVPDSREGWVRLLKEVLDSFFVTGKSLTFSCQCIRSKGALIKGFGGVASGPEELAKGILQIAELLGKRAGKHLRPIDALDIANIIGSIVVSGNVRRSAEIAIGHADDKDFLNAKRWDLGGIPNWRAMSNNTIASKKTTTLPDEFWEGYDGKGEPYGLFNLDLAKAVGRLVDGDLYPDLLVAGVNPCQPAFAPVITKAGLRTFADIDIGSEIWSETGWTRVVDKWCTGVKKVYKYTTTAGSFIGTTNHKVVSKGTKVEAEDAASIDLLAGPKAAHVIRNVYDIMDGLVLGDGMVHKASGDLVLLCVGEKDADYHSSEIAPLLAKHRPGIDEKVWEVTTSITPEELPKTYLRSIPQRFVYANAGRICSFLRGLFSANGNVLKCGRVCLKASSRRVVDDAQLMLSSVGIRSYITTNKEFENVFSNGTYTCKESYNLNIYQDSGRFAALIGFVQKYKQERLLDAVAEKEGKSQGREKTTYKVINVEYLGDHKVFDITVDNAPHTYWTGGLNVSNCAEQTLEPDEGCCLVEQHLPRIKDSKQFHEVAECVYKIAKTMISLPQHWARSAEVIKRNRRIGIGVTGVCQAPHIKDEHLDSVYKHLREIDVKYSRLVGMNPSIKITTVKPSGSVSLLPGVTPGVHPAYAPYYVRRVRMSGDDPLVETARAHGYSVEPLRNFDGGLDHNTMVVSFPVQTPGGTLLAKDMSAVDQIRMQRRLQTYWSDNAVSVTVYYRKEELPAIKAELAENYEKTVKSISFLLHNDHGFHQAPYEAISREAYLEMSSKCVPITSLDDAQARDFVDSQECSGGACPVK